MFLPAPTWSVRSLLRAGSTIGSPTGSSTTSTTSPLSIPRLAALAALPPPPAGSAAEASLAASLRARLSFVEHVRATTTTTATATPLAAIRDESDAHSASPRASLSLANPAIAAALDDELPVGTHYRRYRRRRWESDHDGDDATTTTTTTLPDALARLAEFNALPPAGPDRAAQIALYKSARKQAALAAEQWDLFAPVHPGRLHSGSYLSVRHKDGPGEQPEPSRVPLF